MSFQKNQQFNIYKRMRYGIVIVIVFLLLWILAKLPAWMKNSDQVTPDIDWSQVIDDPDKHLTYTLVQGATYPEAMLEENAFAQKVLEERFNVTLNYAIIDPVAYNRKGPLSWAAGIIPDIFVHSSTLLGSQDLHGFLVAAVKHGFIIPVPIAVIIDHAPTFARMIDKYADNAWIAGSVDGKNYTLPQISPPAKQPAIGIWRKDWLDAVGIMKTPDTIEEYTVAFQRITDDKPDARSFLNAFGDALNDEQKRQVLDQANPTWAMSGDVVNWRAGMFTPIFGAFNVQPFNWIMVDGELCWGGIQDGSRRALEQLNAWYRAGYIHPDFTQDHKTREEFQKFYASITGYMTDWAFYVELHPDRVRVQTAGTLQRGRDRKILLGLGKSEAETETLLAKAVDRYDSLWCPAAVPAGPEGHRGQRVYGALGTTSYVFGRQLANQPEKVIRWLRMIETVLNDEQLMIQISLGKEGLHWRWQSPNEVVTDSVVKNDEKSRGEYGVISHSSYPESTVSLPPYDTWMRRTRQGLVYDLWSADLRSDLLGVPAPQALQHRYQSKAQLRWNQKYRNIELGDNCIFGDTELLAPVEIAPTIKRLIVFQQSAYAEFIKGERSLEEWDAFVDAFQARGGEELLIKMRRRYEDMQIMNAQVDSMLISVR